MRPGFLDSGFIGHGDPAQASTTVTAADPVMAQMAVLTDVANPRRVDLYTLTMDTKWVPAAPLTRKSWNNMAKELAGFKRWFFREAHTQRQTVQEIVPATANEKPMCALAEPPAFTVLHGDVLGLIGAGPDIFTGSDLLRSLLKPSQLTVSIFHRSQQLLFSVWPSAEADSCITVIKSFFISDHYT